MPNPAPRYSVRSIVHTFDVAFGQTPKAVTILGVQTVVGPTFEVKLDGHNVAADVVQKAIEVEVTRIETIMRLGQ